MVRCDWWNFVVGSAVTTQINSWTVNGWTEFSSVLCSEYLRCPNAVRTCIRRLLTRVFDIFDYLAIKILADADSSTEHTASDRGKQAQILAALFALVMRDYSDKIMRRHLPSTTLVMIFVRRPNMFVHASPVYMYSNRQHQARGLLFITRNQYI